MAKFFNIVLILILLIAGGRLVIRVQEYRALSQERERLVEKLDGFQVRDRSKYLVQLVETDDPMRFKWRVYIPGGFKTRCLTGFGSSRGSFGSGLSSDGRMEAASVCFELVGEEIYIDSQSTSGGQRSRCGGTDLVAFCKQHWSDLEIEVLGRGTPVEVDVDQKVDLLSITISDELLAKMESKFGKDLARRFSKRMFCRFGFGEVALIERSRQQLRGGP